MYVIVWLFVYFHRSPRPCAQTNFDQFATYEFCHLRSCMHINDIVFPILSAFGFVLFLSFTFIPSQLEFIYVDQSEKLKQIALVRETTIGIVKSMEKRGTRTLSIGSPRLNQKFKSIWMVCVLMVEGKVSEHCYWDTYMWLPLHRFQFVHWHLRCSLRDCCICKSGLSLDFRC